jgi:hypothetical protein
VNVILTGRRVLTLAILMVALLVTFARATPAVPCPRAVADELGIAWSPDDGATERLDDFARLVADRCP